MENTIEKKKIRNFIVNFIEANNWKEDISDYEYKLEPSAEEYRTFHKEGNIGIDISLDEIVLIDDTGDFKHININHSRDATYTLLGFLINYRYLDINFKGV